MTANSFQYCNFIGPPGVIAMTLYLENSKNDKWKYIPFMSLSVCYISLTESQYYLCAT